MIQLFHWVLLASKLVNYCTSESWFCAVCHVVCSVLLKAAANDFHLTSICAHTCGFIPETDRMFVRLTAAQRSLHSQPTSSRIFWHMQSTSQWCLWCNNNNNNNNNNNRSIIVSKMTKSLYRHYRRFRERMTEEMGLQMFPENRCWRCRRDVYRQSVPQSGSSDRKSSIADGWKIGAWIELDSWIELIVWMVAGWYWTCVCKQNMFPEWC